MEKLKKVSRAQWCLFALFIGFAFLMQNCQDDDALIYEENQTETELNARPVSGKVDVCRYNERKGTFSIVSVVAKRVLPGDVSYGQDDDVDGYYRMSGCPELGNPKGEGYWDCDDTNSAITTTSNFYRDADNDTFGDPSDIYAACVAPEGYVANNLDCDDTNAAINPGVVEICDDVLDNNCNGEVDEGCLVVSRTFVPDNNFEQALIDLSLDDVLDDYVDTANINTETSLNIVDKGISDLTGIGGFTNLEILTCWSNFLISLDLSQNTALIQLDCSYNSLTSLDISNCANLTTLYCYSNQLESLDVSKNAELIALYCSHNALTSLDVNFNTALIILDCSSNNLGSLNINNCTVLEELYCATNQIQSLDVSSNIALVILQCQDNDLRGLDVNSNTALTYLYCYFNTNLVCIQVTQLQIDTYISGWVKDDHATFSLLCPS